MVDKKTEKEQSIHITFFIPCYNEEGNIQATISNIAEAIKDFSFNYEILAFNDASTDNTLNILYRIKEESPEMPLTIINNKQNRGLGFNYFKGSFIAKGQYYMLVNGDNVEPVGAINTIVSHCGEADMIIPYFGANESRSIFRKSVSWIFTAIVNLITWNNIKYYNGPVLHTTENIRFWRSETIGYGYQAELICRLLHEKTSYIQVAVPNTQRERGFSKAFSFSNIFSVSNSLLHIFWRRLEYGVFRLLVPGVTKNDITQ